MPSIMLEMPFAYEANFRRKGRRNFERCWLTAVRPFQIRQVDETTHPLVLREDLGRNRQPLAQYRHDGERFYKAMRPSRDVVSGRPHLCRVEDLVRAMGSVPVPREGRISAAVHSRSLGYPLPSIPKDKFKTYFTETEENDTFSARHRDDAIEFAEIESSTFDDALAEANRIVSGMIVVDGIVHVACEEPVLACKTGPSLTATPEPQPYMVVLPVRASGTEFVVERWGPNHMFFQEILDPSVFRADAVTANVETVRMTLCDHLKGLCSVGTSFENPEWARDHRDVVEILVRCDDVALGNAPAAEIYDLMETYLHEHGDTFPISNHFRTLLQAVREFGSYRPREERLEIEKLDAEAIDGLILG